jgi:hypothetical protein
MNVLVLAMILKVVAKNAMVAKVIANVKRKKTN